MRILAAQRIGLAGFVAISITSGLFAQNQPFITLGGTDQAQPEGSSLPSSGLTLERPRDIDLGQGGVEGLQRPSDGLGLQIYGGGSLATPGRSDGEPERLPDNRLPGH
jgi:hypothetical protein